MLIRQTNDQRSLIGFLRNRVSGDGQGREGITKDTLEQVRDQLGDSGADTSRLDAIIADYDKIDLNGDGISPREFTTYKKHGLKGDFEGKSFTKDELMALRERLQNGSHESNPALDAVIRNFHQADTDGDGAITMAEMRAYAKAHGLALYAKRGAPKTEADDGDDVQGKQTQAAAVSLLRQSALNDPLITGASATEADSSSGAAGLTPLLAVPREP